MTEILSGACSSWRSPWPKWQHFSCRLEKRLLIISNLHSDHRADSSSTAQLASTAPTTACSRSTKCWCLAFSELLPTLVDCTGDSERWGSRSQTATVGRTLPGVTGIVLVLRLAAVAVCPGAGYHLR